MYIKPDEGLKNKLYENRNNIIAGIISHGFSNSRFVDYFGIIIGLLTGLIVVIPNFAETMVISFLFHMIISGLFLLYLLFLQS